MHTLLKLADPEQEYAKNKELKRDDVRNLKEWAEKQAHLPKMSGEEKEKVLGVFVCVCLCQFLWSIKCSLFT